MVTIASERLPTLLRAEGPDREVACQELRDLLVRGALAYLVRQRYPAEAFGADTYTAVAEDYAHDALVVILRDLDAFRGESRFTTWAYRIVITLIADEMRRRLWRRWPRTGDSAAAPGPLIATADAAADAVAERHALWGLIHHIVRVELTPRQRHALVGRIVEGKPLVVLAAELGTDKDNVYKLIHDARKRLVRALRARGVSAAEVLSAFQDRSL